MALSNDFKVLTWIANKGLAYLLTNLAYTKCGTTEYMPEFDNNVYAKGDTIQVRRANRRVGGEGATIALDGVIEKTEPLTIEKQFNDGLVFTSKEEALFQTGSYGQQIYSERYILPSILRLISQVNSYMAERASKDIYYSTGAAGTPINSTGYLATLNAKMMDYNIPTNSVEKYLIINPSDGAALKNSMVNYYNSTFNKGIGEKFFVKQVMDFLLEETSSVPVHTVGAAYADLATLKVNADVTSGNTIVIKGITPSTTGAFKKGDIISIAGSKVVVSPTYNTTAHDAQFVVQADVDATAGGLATITVSPEIIIDTTNPFRNLSAKLAADAVVTLVNTHNEGVAFTKGALSFAMPKMKQMWTPYSVSVTDNKFGTGITLRLSRGADIVNDQNILRFDVLCGARFWGEYSVKAIS